MDDTRFGGVNGAARRVLALALLLCLGSAACGSHASDPATKATKPRDAGTDSGTAPGARIYASVSADNQVVVVDEKGQAVLSKISVGAGPAIILATPDHKQLYTANWADNTVSAIAVDTQTVTSIAVTGRPYVIAMDPAGKYVYAGLSSNQIALIDTSTNQIASSITTPDLPASITVSPDGKTLYVAAFNVLGGGAPSRATRAP
jgi:YVTN family beta-propeller protein